MTSNRDLRKFMNNQSTFDAFSRLVSGGKAGYKTIIETKKEIPICLKCGRELTGEEKFCPECGEKTAWQKKKEEPVIILTTDELEQKFKAGEEREADILAYLRDILKMSDAIAFDLINQWRKESQEASPSQSIDLNQFSG